MNLPLLVSNPRSSYLASKEAIDQATLDFYNNPYYVLGDYVSDFEARFAGYIGVPHAVGVANGTDAITLALMALNIQPGDEIITVSHTAVATVVGIERAGAVPVLVDVDPDSKTIDVTKIPSMITARTKAIIAVHLYGQPADLDTLRSICSENDLFLIEDCAQSHGATYHGQKTGTFGDLATFSFYPTKNLGAIGDGGAVVTSSPELNEKLRMLRQYGWKTPQYSLLSGMNSRLDGLQAAILTVKLAKLDSDIARRQHIASTYTAHLANLPVVTPKTIQNTTHAYHLYVIELESQDTRDQLMSHLKAAHIFAGIHYPFGVHEQPAYDQKLRCSDMTHTNRLTKTILSLPMYPELSDQEVKYVCDYVSSFF